MNKFAKSIVLGSAILGIGAAPVMAATTPTNTHKAHAAKVVKAKKAKKTAAAPK